MPGQHVLLIPSFYPTPAYPTHGVFFRDQARALAEHGSKVGVLSVVELAPWQEREFWRAWPLQTREVDDGGVLTVQRPVRRWWPGRHWSRVQRWVRTGLGLYDRYVQSRGAPNLLHAHVADPGGVLALEIKKQFRLPVVLTEHASWLALGTKGEVSDAVARNTYQSADVLLAVSADLADRLAARFDVPRERWRSVPNVVDPAFLQLPLSSRAQGPAGAFSFLYVANLLRRKGHSHLLHAFAKMFGGEGNVRLRLVGGGPLRSELARQATKLGITDQVTFLGRLPRTGVLHEVQHTDAIVVPSEFETFGVMVIEGMAAGKPVVATRCGGPETIIEGACGLLVDVGDINGLAEALVELRENHDQYDPATIRRIAEEKYSPAAVAGALQVIYAEQLANWSGG